MARTEEEITGGYFLVSIGGEEVALPELSFGEAREWSRASAAAFGPVFDSFEREWKPGDGLLPVEEANQAAMDIVVGAIADYDRTGVLGGRAGIERLSTSGIRRLHDLLYEEAHPFAGALETALLQMATLRVNGALAAQSAGASSTNGSSPAGAMGRAKSASGSRRRSSSSSGDAASSALSASASSSSR